MFVLDTQCAIEMRVSGNILVSHKNVDFSLASWQVKLSAKKIQLELSLFQGDLVFWDKKVWTNKVVTDMDWSRRVIPN